MKRTLNLHIDEEANTEGSWAISYGDMITLLLSFFVLYFSFDFEKDQNEKLENSVTTSMIESLKIEGDSFIPHIDKMKNGNIIMFFKGSSFFDSGKTNLNSEGENLVTSFSKKYLPFAGKYKVKVQAFTDNTPVNKTNNLVFQDNIELSALRSVSVLKKLKQLGIPVNRIEIGGKGILSKKSYQILNIDSDNKEESKRLSRTVAFILEREDV